MKATRRLLALAVAASVAGCATPSYVSPVEVTRFTGDQPNLLRAGPIAVRDFRLSKHLSFGVGGLVSLNFVPDALASEYGGNNPTGAMGFVRLKLD